MEGDLIIEDQLPRQTDGVVQEDVLENPTDERPVVIRIPKV